MWTLKTQAIRAPQIYAVTLRNFLQLGRLMGVDASRKHQSGTAFDATGNLQRRGQLVGCRGDDRQIGLGIGQISQCAAGVNIEKCQATGKVLRAQGLVQDLCLACLRLRRVCAASNHNDGAGRKKWREKMLVHTDSN